MFICYLVSDGSKIWASLGLDLDQLVSMCPVIFVYVFNFKYFSGLVSSAPHSHELLHGHELPVDVLRRPTLTHRSRRGKYNVIIFITPNYFVVINTVVKGVLYFPRCLPKILPDSPLKSTWIATCGFCIKKLIFAFTENNWVLYYVVYFSQ